MMNDRAKIVDLEYPRNPGNPSEVIVGLMDVRAADSLYISYDFDRDGWRIGMDETKEADWGMEVVRENVEVAFVPAWNLAIQTGEKRR
jgi:hypothetical protein